MRRTFRALIGGAVCIAAASAGASTLSFTIGEIPGQFPAGQYVVVFDLVNGAPEANSVTISDFGTNGFVLDASTSGSVSQVAGVGTVFSDASPVSEYRLRVMAGSYFRFDFDGTNSGNGGAGVDTFGISLKSTAGDPLFTTSDPTGANALARIDLVTGTVLNVYDDTLVHAFVPTVPEPANLWLLLAGLPLVAGFRRFGRTRKPARRGSAKA